MVSMDEHELRERCRQVMCEEVYFCLSALVWRLSKTEEMAGELVDVLAPREIFEHWAVSRWLAKKLLARGEAVLGWEGLNIWGRTTTGQAISMDGVIREIVAELHG